MLEVIQLDDDDGDVDDVIQSINPSAPRKSTDKNAVASSSNGARAIKRPPPPISTRIDSDPILKPSTSSTFIDEEECPICGRDLKLLNEHRRTLHLNSCLDVGESKAEYDNKMEKWKSTMDCPVCKTPLAAGPFRSAHMKKCGREHAINGRDLLNLVTTQEKVTETRRKRGLAHTGAKTPKQRPKKVSKLDGEPKSLAEEELIMAKALSASMVEPNETEKEEEEEWQRKKEEKKEKIRGGVSPQFTRIINENIRKRRSYAVVELAPRGCRCDVIELTQSRFLRVFRARRKVINKVDKTSEEKKKKKGEEKEVEAGVKERLTEGGQRTVKRVQMEATMANSLARLDSLSWAYRNLAMEGEQKGDLSIECSDGQIRAFSWTLLARTTALGRVLGENAKISIDQSTTVVRHWLQYVYCARVEWAAGEENEGVREIGKLHGPEGLLEECARMSKTRREYLGFERIGVMTGEATEATVPQETTVPPMEAPEATALAVESPEEGANEEPEVPPAEEESVPSDDARVGEKEEKQREGSTIDSEGSMNEALKKCVAEGRTAARLSSPGPIDGSFLAALEASPIIEIVQIAVSTPTTVPPLQERLKDSFFDSIVYGETPKRKEEDPPTAVIPPSTVVQPADPSESTESMDESDAVRDILDVSCLRRSPTIRVEAEKKEERREIVISPELFHDSDESESEKEAAQTSQRVLPPPRRSPRRSLTQPLLVDTVTPTSRRPSQLRNSIIEKKRPEVIYLDDTPLSSPVPVAQTSTVLVEKKEEITVDESFPRADLPSYGQGGLDTAEGGEEEEGNREDAMEDGGPDDFHLDYDDYGDAGECNWDNNGEGLMDGEEGEADPVMATRAQEEVDSFLNSLGWRKESFNQTREKFVFSPPKNAPPTEEVDSFMLSLRMGGEEEKEREEGTGDILGALSPVRNDTASTFKTPTVRGGRGRGRGRGARGGGAVFGSHVKVLKWSNVTPKPRFEAMDDDALKAQLARYGLRAMGRKRAIATLSEIYEQTHPVVDESAAGPSTSSCSTSSNAADAASVAGDDISPTRRPSTAADEEEDENDGEKTLNRGADSSDDENSERGGGGVGEAEESMIIPKAMLKGADAQLVLFLEWLRQPQQKDLYDHCLALKSVSLEEIEVKVKRADSSLCGISRNMLMCVLDRLHITYSLRQDPSRWKKLPKK